VAVEPDVALNVAIGGSGSPIVLLHSFPQTHLTWRHVAADLAADHTVICPDLRGYGASDKPAERDATTYAKRTMAADIVTLAGELGDAASPSPATTGVRWSPSGPASTTPR
jgi:pimeloyl-ACP methyl ester carboxylesterase